MQPITTRAVLRVLHGPPFDCDGILESFRGDGSSIIVPNNMAPTPIVIERLGRIQQDWTAHERYVD
jgi:hypothetical protein